ncbi:capsular biosynthesis protein [uncultured Roseibium sp.]|uniref:capsule biosynthesis protein n=1 Tax=uncultured Roseibium sp. TaxID=1936171 RepID=UPI002599994F|nr:capsular biosynthesis protein [uncultured Roseibium sp.]
MSGRAELPADVSRRTFLFLQGPLSPLYKKLGTELLAAGCRVRRINFCSGDWLHWHGAGTTSFKNKTDAWPSHIAEFLEREGITDLVLHGDQRIYHKAAITEAKKRCIRVFVTELGLLRSGWMTLEREGLATLSRFPNDADAIRSISNRAGDIDFAPLFPKSPALEIVPDVIYNLTNVFLKPLYPHYQRHTLYPPVLEYLRGAWRLSTGRRRDRLVRRQINALRPTGNPYFIFPLQLEGDFQLRAHSPYKSFAEVIETVVTSFAKNASAASQLVIKTHPLDVGFENWPALVAELKTRHQLAERIVFLNGGRLGDLFDGASGLVTLNSTAGIEAMQAGVPVKSLMPAHYDIEGMTHQGDLSGFWTSPERPDLGLLTDYLRAIAATVQVRGSIHNREGVEAAAKNMAQRILDLSVNEPGAFCPVPPRLEKARTLGVPL